MASKSLKDNSKGSLELPYTSAGNEIIGKLASTKRMIAAKTLPQIIPLMPKKFPK